MSVDSGAYTPGRRKRPPPTSTNENAGFGAGGPASAAAAAAAVAAAAAAAAATSEASNMAAMNAMVAQQQQLLAAAAGGWSAATVDPRYTHYEQAYADAGGSDGSVSVAGVGAGRHKVLDGTAYRQPKKQRKTSSGVPPAARVQQYPEESFSIDPQWSDSVYCNACSKPVNCEGNTIKAHTRAAKHRKHLDIWRQMTKHNGGGANGSSVGAGNGAYASNGGPNGRAKASRSGSSVGSANGSGHSSRSGGVVNDTLAARTSADVDAQRSMAHALYQHQQQHQHQHQQLQAAALLGTASLAAAAAAASASVPTRRLPRHDYPGDDQLSPKERCKKHAAFAAVDERLPVDQSQRLLVLGIGSGSTIVYAVRRIAELTAQHHLQVICVPTSFQARQLIQQAGLLLGDLTATPSIDIAFDGADEADRFGNVIKGGGGCLTQEKIVAAAAQQLYLIADYTKQSQSLGDKWEKGIPVEVIPMAHMSVSKQLAALGGTPVLRMARAKAGPVVTDNGNFILDVWFGKHPDSGPASPAELHHTLIMIPGIVETGFFCNMANSVYFGQEDGTVSVLDCKAP